MLKNEFLSVPENFLDSSLCVQITSWGFLMELSVLAHLFPRSHGLFSWPKSLDFATSVSSCGFTTFYYFLYLPNSSESYDIYTVGVYNKFCLRIVSSILILWIQHTHPVFCYVFFIKCLVKVCPLIVYQEVISKIILSEFLHVQKCLWPFHLDKSLAT